MKSKHINTKLIHLFSKASQVLMVFVTIFSLIFTGWQPAKAAPAGTALQFNGSATDKQYVTFGATPGLGVTTFTLEAWVKRAAGGLTMSTGSLGFDGVDGRPNGIYPVVTKGMGQAETPPNVNMNYFLGITVGGAIGADFEDKAGGTNHPIWGNTPVAVGEWHHIAVTYTGACWAIYLDGNPETMNGTVCPNATPESISIQHAGLAAGLNSSGALGLGFFSGSIDEARIWNRALSAGEIIANKSLEVSSGTGLLARWGLNEATGTAIVDSVGSFPGTVKSSTANLPTWVAGFPLPDTTPPAAPTGLTATPFNGGVSLSWTAPADLDVAGYNVYRATAPSVPLTSPINGGTLVTGTTYSNPGLINGTPYYYVVTAVDASTNQSVASNEVNATPLLSLGNGLAFDGSNDYVTFGPVLNVTNFTLEAWVKRAAGGATMTTGSLGLDGTSGRPLAFPVLTKGMGQGETPANINMNYFLGITETGVVGADFEDNAGGVNHPAWGTTDIPVGGWHHIAATYNGSCWALYLDGNLETLNASATGCPNAVPEFNSIQYAGLAAGIGSTGQLSSGFFSGVIDEARVWNVARSQTEIRSTINAEVTSGTGLLARWGITEGSGTTIASSVGTFPGILTNGPTWTGGAPFNIIFDTTPPGVPTNLMASAQPGQVLLEWTANTETDLAGYRVYRSTSSPVTKGTPLNSALLVSPAFVDQDVTASTTYHYAVSAVDTFNNESGLSGEVSAIPLPPPPAEALRLGSSQAYVALGDVADVPQFTLETWLRRDGAGTPASSGTGGVNLVPVIANGTAEAETAAADVNYFFGIQETTNFLCADFEEAQSGASPGLNHPACGVTPLVNNTWYHVAATYDGSTWRLYLNGNLDGSLSVGRPANAANTAPLAFGTSLKTTNATNGFFNGVLDEVRIWDYARSQAQIASTINAKLTTPQTGLIGRWGLDEASGSVAGDSSGSGFDGTITGIGYSWVAGSPFSTVVNLPPNAPQLIAPANNATNVSTPVTLSVNVSDPENAPLNVTFYGRALQAAAGPDFTIAVIPDAQYYAASFPAIYNAQMQWLADNKISNNIVYAASLGDNVDVASNTTQWTRADAAYDILDAANVAYGVEAGNHDGAPTATDNFNANFGVSRFTGKSYYGGHFGSDNDNNYALFEASGLKFIVIYIEYDGAMTSSSHPVLQWANNLLATNSDRRGIVISHNLLQGGTSNAFSPQGQAIYDALKGNPNLFLMNGGHLDVASRRTDVSNGNTVFSLRSDYQSVDSQQSGYLRLLRFSPADDMIYVRTYSPTQNKDYDKSDAAQSNFSLQYPMDGVGFEVIGTDTNVSSGGTASVSWAGLEPSKHYEWYVVATDGTHQTSSSTWNFTTAAAANQPPVITQGASTTVNMSEDGAPTAFSLTLNATDPNITDTLTWSISTQAAHGSATASGTGASKAVAYSPALNYNGSDSFVVMVSDGNGGSDAITVHVSIASINDAPVCSPVSLNTNENTIAEATPDCLDVDTGDTLTYSIVAQPTHGSASVVAGKLSYTPAANYYGPDSFTYKANDGTLDSNISTVTVTVANTCHALNLSHTGQGSNPTATPANSTGCPAGKYIAGQSISLSSAVPATGWQIASWSGTNNNASTGNTNTVTMGAIDQSAGVNYIQTVYTLTITKVGNGTVTPDKAAPYHYGDVVLLTAAADPGWTFANWSVDATGTTSPVSVTMNANKAVTATFTQNVYTLTITKNGNGTVTPDIAAPYHYGDVVQLTAAADPGWTFANWSVDATGTTNPVSVTMNANKAVTATFTQNVYTLTITKIGNGTVTPDKAAPYHYGDVVQLTAAADPGWTFANWSVDATGTTNPVSVTMNANKAVTATFTQNVYTLTITKVGNGTVTPDKAAPYHYNDVVKLTAAGDPGWSFASWSGDITSTTNPLNVLIVANTTVNAIFTLDALDTTLLVAPAAGTFGNTVDLSATLTQTVGGAPVSGKTIIFKLNGATVGSAVTNASGIAALNAASLAGIAADSYPAGVSASFAGDTGFKLSSDTDALQVNKRAITVKADPKNKLIGEIDPPLTYTLINGTLVDPDVFSGSLTRDAGETAGVYAIRQGSLALSPNYELLYQGATFTINLHPNPTISGNAGVGGASLSVSGGSPVTAAADGSYTITVPYNWSGTVTPSKANYTFLPVSKDYTNLQTNQTTQNYTAKLTIAKPAVPVTVSPIGVLTDGVPTYVWKPSAGATSYWLSVYNQSKGAYAIKGMVVPASVCTGTPSLCKFRPSVALGTYNYRFSVAAVNLAGNSGFSPWAGWKIFTVRKLAAFTSIASQDGYLLESSETSGVGGMLNSSSASLMLGDDAKNRQYRSILSFNTFSLPDNAVIVSATLKLKKAGTQGVDPFTTHGALLVDIRKPFFGASAGLQLDDFAALASLNNAGAVGKIPVAGFNISKLSGPGLLQVNKIGFTQLRLRFLMDDDNDSIEDLLAFYSGNSVTPAYRPVLEIVYYIP